MYCSLTLHLETWTSFITIEELDDVCEVHVVLQNDVSVDLHQREGDEQPKMAGGDVLGSPDGLPHREHIIVN